MGCLRAGLALDAVSRSSHRRAHLLVVQRQNLALLRVLNLVRLARVVSRQTGG